MFEIQILSPLEVTAVDDMVDLPAGSPRPSLAADTPASLGLCHAAAQPACVQEPRRTRADGVEIFPETRIERIYAKTGASTRPTVTHFAMRHGLLDTLEPVDL
jgi:hypothetical protein